jgi:hypothetical protein
MNNNFATLTAQEKTAIAAQNKSGKDEGMAIVPVPDDAPLAIPVHSLGTPAKVWEYRNAPKRLLCKVARFISPDGEKEDRPLTYRQFRDGSHRWAWKALDAPRPLYGLDRLAAHPGAPVIVCEGEKATDAVAVLFPGHVAVTSPNGAGSPHKADWTSLAGRTVIIWPDQDDEGRKYAAAVAQLALKAGAVSVAIVQVPKEFPEKWDVADQLPDGFADDDLQRLITEAQPVTDPLDGLVERATADTGEAFRLDVIEALLNLKQADRSAFESLRSKLKKAGVRVTELDKAMREESGYEAESDPSQADILVELASVATLFHTPDSTAYADFEVNGHRETWPVRSKGFKRWLTRLYYAETDSAPNSESLNAALNVIESKAHYDAEEHEIFIRVGGQDGKIYLDLCRDDWRVVEIDSAGWRVIESPPVRFRRTGGMLPLTIPKARGSVNGLRQFLNVKDDANFVLVVAWILAAMRNNGPYPVLVLSGEQGSAKSTFATLMKKILDPNSAPLRTLPRDDRDLFIAANNGHVLAFDNLSAMPAGISDNLCRLATGGGFATRQLYSDQDEMLFNAMRPIILNGIDDVVTRPDLADRAILQTLEAIPEDKRRTEKELLSAFERELPGILGALLDAVAHGLRELPRTQLSGYPRMADFALWGTACEGALWPSGTFTAAYEGNRNDAVDNVIEANPVASAVRSFMDGRTVWTGTAAQLLQECGNIVGDTTRESKTWPKFPNALSSQLRRAATFLRKTGIDVNVGERSKDRNRTRTITIKKTADNGGNSPSAPSRPSEQQAFPDIPADDLWTQTLNADDAAMTTVRTEAAEIMVLDDTDGLDDEIRCLSDLDDIGM